MTSTCSWCDEQSEISVQTVTGVIWRYCRLHMGWIPSAQALRVATDLAPFTAAIRTRLQEQSPGTVREVGERVGHIVDEAVSMSAAKRALEERSELNAELRRVVDDLAISRTKAHDLANEVVGLRSRLEEATALLAPYVAPAGAVHIAASHLAYSARAFATAEMATERDAARAAMEEAALSFAAINGWRKPA